ncbi:acyltransferase family protein [Janibacter sp. GS2]|uniref:acyltransferase family protein n=1 Tax=Janibacter sp. GS2 TaxID=3442646 RepID=UPI003EBEA00C
MARSRFGYSPALDGLRGVFILLFIGFHFGLTQLEGMWVTINLFFVLSGFLIFRLLTAEDAKYGSIDVLAFYRRRIRRLVPALLVMLTAVAAWGALFAPDGLRRKLGGDLLATLGYGMNWRLIAQGDQYFGTAGGASPLRHAWTLAIEEQFYLVAPLVIIALFAWFGSRRTAVGVLLLGAVVSAVWTAHLGFHDQSDYPRVYYGSDTRAQALFIGAAIGVLSGPVSQRTRAPELPMWLIEWGGLVGLISSVISFAFVTPYSAWMFNQGGMLAFGIGSALLVLACADRRTNLTRTLFAWRPLAFVGERTYGLYLWHWPIYVALAPTPLGDHPVLLFIIGMAATVLVAHLSYTYLEQPIITRGIRGVLPRTRRPLLASLLPVALVAVLGFGLVRTAPGGQDAGSTSVAGELPDIVEGQASYRPGDPGRIGVLGDSVPYFLAERFPDEQFPGVTLDNHAREGCDLLDEPISWAPGLSKTTEPWCVVQKREWPQDFTKGDDDILLLFASPLVGLPHLVDGERLWLDDARFRAVITDRFETVYTQAKDAGARQVQIVNVPCRVPPKDIPEEVEAVLESEPELLAEYKNPKILNDLIDDWAGKHPDDVRVVDLASALCADGYPETLHGAPVYNDFLHFSPEVTPMLWKWLLGQVSENYARLD